MHQRAAQRCERRWAPRFLRLAQFVCALVLVGRATGDQGDLADAGGPDVGLIEIVNRSPEYLLSIGLFDRGEDCRGLQYVAELEKFKLKSIKAAHRETLSFWVSYSAGSARGVRSCGGIYSLPFVQGDLRVVVEAPDSMKQCLVGMSSSVDRKTWAQVPGSRKRIGRMSLRKDDSWCEKE